MKISLTSITPLFFTLLCSATLSAQAPVPVSGSVVDAGTRQALEFANVLLLQARDSAMVQGAVTDSAGTFVMEPVPEGLYLLSVSMVGYSKSVSSPIAVKSGPRGFRVPPIGLNTDVKVLQEVSVTARKPFIERQIDRLVLNVENSVIAAGGTAMEVLEKAPGILVDKDGNISMRGRQGVIVMIDDKPTMLSGQELTNMLRSLPGDAIEKVEIITNPSAKYDAAGNSGIINIRLRKNQNFGTNGNLRINGGYGNYEKYGASINLNYRDARINAYGQYSYNVWKGQNELNILRLIRYDNQTTYFQQNARFFNSEQTHFAKAGIDFFIDKHNTIGVMASTTANPETNLGNSNTSIQNAERVTETTLKSTDEGNNKFVNGTANVNYKHTFHTTGHELSADLDYAHFNNQHRNMLTSRFFDNRGELSRSPWLIRNDLPAAIDIRSAKVDYSLPLGEKGKLEAGWKSSWVRTDNDARIDSLAGNTWVPDYSKTNHFVYTENINAAYVNAQLRFGKTGIQAGLRAEQTLSKGNSITLNRVVDRNYTQLFPSLFVQHELSKNHQLGLSYSKRIDRPSYRDLNPFVFFADPYTFMQGNPFLRPQITHSFDLSYTFLQMATATLNYARTNDVMVELTQQNDTTKSTWATRYNLDHKDNYSLTLSFPIPIAKWWTCNNNFTGFYSRFSSSSLQGGQLNNAGYGWMLNSQHSFTLPGGYSAEMSVFYNDPGVYGVFRLDPQFKLDAGVQKNFWNNTASLKLSGWDIFGTMRFQGTVRYQNMDMRLSNRWESRQVRLTFSYRFGNKNVKVNRRTSGAEDEMNRVNTGRG